MSTTIYAVDYTGWDEYWIVGLFHSKGDAEAALEYTQEKHKKLHSKKRYPLVWANWMKYGIEEYEITTFEEWEKLPHPQ